MESQDKPTLSPDSLRKARLAANESKIKKLHTSNSVPRFKITKNKKKVPGGYRNPGYFKNLKKKQKRNKEQTGQVKGTGFENENANYGNADEEVSGHFDKGKDMDAKPNIIVPAVYYGSKNQVGQSVASETGDLDILRDLSAARLSYKQRKKIKYQAHKAMMREAKAAKNGDNEAAKSFEDEGLADRTRRKDNDGYLDGVIKASEHEGL